MLIRTRSSYACRDRQLTTNFELWVEIFCVPTCFHVKIPKQCLSVCQYPEKRNHHSFVNISPTIVIDTSMERSSRVLHHENPKIGFFFFFKKVWNLNFDLRRKAEITLASLIPISHTLVIDISMERFSWVLQYRNPKIRIFFKKLWNWILTCVEELKSPKLRQYQSYIGN